MIVLRRGLPIDRLQIQRLHKNCVQRLIKESPSNGSFCTWIVGDKFSPLNFAKYITDSHFVVAEEGGRIVGFCQMDLVLADKKGVIERLYVDVKVQKRGIGGLLMRAQMECARVIGLERVFLESVESAILFYLKQHFTLLQALVPLSTMEYVVDQPVDNMLLEIVSILVKNHLPFCIIPTILSFFVT